MQNMLDKFNKRKHQTDFLDTSNFFCRSRKVEMEVSINKNKRPETFTLGRELCSTQCVERNMWDTLLNIFPPCDGTFIHSPTSPLGIFLPFLTWNTSGATSVMQRMRRYALAWIGGALRENAEQWAEIVG